MIFHFTRRLFPRHRPPEKFRVWLVVGRAVYPLNHERKLSVSISNTVGQPPLSLRIIVTDQHGADMKTQPTPDAPPAWTNTNPSAETLAVAANGLTATATALAEGADEIDVTAVIGGKSFSAKLAVPVNPEPQVASGIRIDTVPPAA